MAPNHSPKLPFPGRVAAQARLAVLGFVALAAGPAWADAVRIIEEPRDAAEERVRLVAEAKHEILAAYFIVGHDPLAQTALALLRDAARRGVAVKLLVDAQWNKIPGSIQAHLLRRGVDLRVYHPFSLHRPHWLTRRLHDKLLIVDGEVLMAGGRNIESPYFDLGKQLARRDYLDCDVLAKGEVAAEARRYFLELWQSREVRLARARRYTEGLAEAAGALDRHQGWIDGKIAEARANGHVVPELVEVGPVRFLHDPVGRKGRARGTGHALYDLLDGARESVLIESPYLVPSRALERGLVAARARGVRIRILTNSLASTDNLWAQAGYVGHRKELVALGIELWEYKGAKTLHSKAAVIDGHRVIIGSYNLDPRSEHLNTETALVFDHPGLAARLAASMSAHLVESQRIDARGWPEGADRPFPGVARAKVWRLAVYRLLAPLIRKQL